MKFFSEKDGKKIKIKRIELSGGGGGAQMYSNHLSRLHRCEIIRFGAKFVLRHIDSSIAFDAHYSINKLAAEEEKCKQKILPKTEIIALLLHRQLPATRGWYLNWPFGRHNKRRAGRALNAKRNAKNETRKLQIFVHHTVHRRKRITALWTCLFGRRHTSLQYNRTDRELT